MPDQSSITIADFDGQTGSMTINSAIVTAANFTAQMAALVTLADTLPAIIDGIRVSYGFSHRIQLASPNAKASDPNAQRGNKWLVHAHDSTLNLGAGVPNPYYQRSFVYEIPTADLELRVDGINQVWVPDGANNVAAFTPFVEAFEPYALSPVGGALVVDLIEAVTSSGG